MAHPSAIRECNTLWDLWLVSTPCGWSFRLQMSAGSYLINQVFSTLIGLLNPSCSLSFELLNPTYSTIKPLCLKIAFQIPVLHEEQDTHITSCWATSLQHAPCVLFLFLHTDALSVFRKYLTPFERREIKEYKEVWYLGIAAEKIQQKCTLRHGYDDRNGHYKMVNTNTCPPEGSYHKPFQSWRMGFVGSSEMYLYLFTVGSLCY